MGFFDGFFGGTNAVEGLSKNASERQQRINEQTSRLGARDAIGASEIYDYLVRGGQFNQQSYNTGQGAPLTSGATGAPKGPAFNLVQGSLNSELGLSNQRQNIANQLLSQYDADSDKARAFGLQQLGMGGRAQRSQEQLFNHLYQTHRGNLGLQDQLFGGLGDYLQSGGAPSQAQAQNISGIFDAQRDVGYSNLNQQFGDAIRQLQDQATSRGLRFNDTPIQDRGGLVAREFARNATNLESSLGGQQANMMLQMPFQQNQVNLGALGQMQNSNLAALNAFSMPITNAFNQQSSINALGQFGAQYSPAAFSGAPLQNMGALLGSGQFASGVPAFSPTQITQTPGFGQTMTQAFGGALGKSAGGTIGKGLAAGMF